MREIKFRGRAKRSFKDFNIEEGDFIYGQVVFDESLAWIVGSVVEANDEYIALENWIPVDIKTIGQYTGLKDKNGVEIYEGDIITLKEFDNYPNCIVKYGEHPKEYWYGWYCDCGNGKYFHVNNAINLCEVIGNIYENPELLKEV